ncbi:MAG: conjugal transfer protein TraF [Chlamydiales bacterium]|nr:conjugal transfer protein TraF [Chlamydiales bacterium]MBY0529907.1 conjugal transfer protein TraF [Rhabdochlamydiaceae bacterium]
MNKFLFLILVAYAPFLRASSSWYEGKLEGWYYFEDRASEVEEKVQLTPEQAEGILQAEKRNLAQLLALALIVPTSENVEQYMREQKKWIDQSGRFAGEWGKLILEHPLMGEFFKNPTTSYGILAKRESDLQKRKILLAKLAKDHFLLFFFQGGDLFSRKAAEVVKLFADLNQWKVKAVSLDGLGLSEYPDFELDKGISAVMGVKASPSLFVVNPFENTVVPVGAGLVTVTDIEENIEIQWTQGD